MAEAAQGPGPRGRGTGEWFPVDFKGRDTPCGLCHANATVTCCAAAHVHAGMLCADRAIQLILHMYVYTYVYIYTYTYIYIYVYVCVMREICCANAGVAQVVCDNANGCSRRLA